MRETKFQKDCLDWINDNHRGRLIAVNIHGGGYSNKGFPDILVFGDQKAVAIELKSDSGYKIQADQLIWRRRFLAVGTHHYVIDDFDAFVEVISKEFDLHEDQE
jgi:hypothetical protein